MTHVSDESRVASLEAELAEIVGPRWVRLRPSELAAFRADGLPTHESTPGIVVIPGSRDEVIEVVRFLARAGIPFVARGAGTGLASGGLAEAGQVLLVLTRLNRILRIDQAARRAVVQPGVVNAKLSEATAPHGLYYAPDPSSQSACTLGGNVA
jgi:glycolate oxidase